jgi:ArsR family transcriptional regulator
MSESFATVLEALKAAAEPTRLRLLELLTHGELTVGEISLVLGQSQPRISRHLKVLCDAGLLDRFREEHWVYYRVRTDGIGHELAERLSFWMAKEDAVLQADRRKMATIFADRVKGAIETATAPLAAETLGELHDALIDELAGEPIGELLDIGTGTGLLLRALGANATRAVGVDISTEALRIARTQTHRAGLSHCLFRRGDMYNLPFADRSFDTVTMDRVLTEAVQPEAAIAEAARTLRPGGRLCVIEDFDALAERVEVNPLNVVRDWLAAASLRCERIKPKDTQSSSGSTHVLIMIGRTDHVARQAA